MKEEAENHAQWIRRYFDTHGLKNIPVIPVLLFPRWKVQSKWDRLKLGTLVFSAKAFNTEYANFPEIISIERFENAKMAVCKLAQQEGEIS